MEPTHVGCYREIRVCRIEDHSRHGFTLTELLVVLGTLAILAVMLLPALAGTQPRSKAYQCLNNMRQLALAWTLYAGEHNEYLPLNFDPRSNPQVPGYIFNGSPSWASGVVDYTTGQYNTNTADLVDDRYSLLGSYLGRNYEIFACPACAYFVSPIQRTKGWDHRLRSVAMNAAVGGGPKYSVSNFGWNASSWYVANKSTDFNNPGPSQTWVFSDEHPDSIDDALIYISSYPTTMFTELPANQHDGAASLTFADGHVEMHRWIGPVLPNRPALYTGQRQIPCTVTDPDMVWLAQHTPQPQ
jgi:prepilin-type N-terminal cleavage/methylation domain-containing protein/prepilin-type processing-associated H-X9-DG protein